MEGRVTFGEQVTQDVGVSADHFSVKRYSALLVTVCGVVAALMPSGPVAAAPVSPQPDRLVVRTGTVPAHFTVSSFNVLGSSHTAPGGRHARMASGVKRTRMAIRLLEKTSVDVVGLQELQSDQREEFVRVAGDRFAMWPQNDLTRRNVQNSLAWRTAEWELVEGRSVGIPYFEGEDWDMPYVLLRHRESGVTAWFANFHAPSTSKSRRGAATWRAEGRTRQMALVNRLVDQTKTSVFVTGDMNEREVYYCAMAGGAPVKAANGGQVDDAGCTPPPNPMPVNWILGVKGGGSFSNYVRDDSTLVNKITDHYVVRADVWIRRGRVTDSAPLS